MSKKNSPSLARLSVHLTHAVDVRVCTVILIFAVGYMFAHVGCSQWPEPFPGAEQLDGVVYSVCLSYLASYVFFIIVVAFPRSYAVLQKIQAAREHINAFKQILDSFQKDVGFNFNEQPNSFMIDYINKGLSSNTCSVTFHSHLGGWEYHTCITIADFIIRVAKRAEYSCPIIQEMLQSDGMTLFGKIEAVQFRAYEVLHPATDLEGEIGASSDPDYPGLLSSLWCMVQCFEKKYGQ